MLNLIIKYNKSSTRHFHITKIFDYLVDNNTNFCYAFVDFDDILNNSTDEHQLTDFFISKYNELPKYIISFGGIGSFLSIINIITNVTKLALIIDDIHHGKSIRRPRIPVINKSDIIFCTYAYQFTKWGLPQPSNLYMLPHSAAWLPEFNEKPIKKVLISGRISDIYPDRQYELSIAMNDSDNFDILDCNINYRSNDSSKGICGKKFYYYLNKYLCCFVDTARDYILAKTFEICASGSLLLCMDTNVKKIMNDLGFIDGENYISCTRENFMEKINWILNSKNIDIINKIRKNGYKLIKDKHTWKNRLEFLTNIIEHN